MAELYRLLGGPSSVRPLSLAWLASAMLLLNCGARQGLGENETQQAETLATDRALAARPAPRIYMGRTIAPTMSYSGADWLTRKSREQEERPQELLDALKVEAGNVICDFGCGNGYHTLQLARRVGPRGVVFGVDIQPEMLELLKQRAEPRGIKNVELILAEAEDPHLPKNTFDLVLMVDVYHELDDPAQILAAVRAALKPSGRLVLVEFREEDPEVPIRPLHKMSKEQVFKELTASGFKLVGQYDRLPWQHVLQFAAKTSELPAEELKPWQPPPFE